MNEYKFSCRHCGQHLAGDESWAGRQIKCPSCQTDFVVPPVAPPTSPPIPPAPPLAVPPPIPPRAAPVPPLALPARPGPAPVASSGTTVCALAIVAFVLALLTVPLNVAAQLVGFPIGLLSCIPAVICGHMALNQIRGSRNLKGTGLAKTGLILGYLFILVGVVALGFLAYAKLTGQAVPSKRRNQSGFQTSGQPLGGSVGHRESGRTSTKPSDTVAPPEPVDPPVTTDLRSVVITNAPLSGTVFGQPFRPQQAKVWGGSLTLTQAKNNQTELEIWIAFFKPNAEDYVGKTIIVAVGQQGITPHVHLRQMTEGYKTKVYTKDYVMRLEFGQPVGRKLPGKIYLEMPQSSATIISGNFLADLQ